VWDALWSSERRQQVGQVVLQLLLTTHTYVTYDVYRSLLQMMLIHGCGQLN
jgi:hypothetical protein